MEDMGVICIFFFRWLLYEDLIMRMLMCGRDGTAFLDDARVSLYLHE